MIAEVTPLHATKGQHDVVLHGKTFYFKAQGCGEHIHLAYVETRKLSELVPEYMRPFVDTTDRETSITVASVTVRRTRLERFFGISLERKTCRYVKKLKKTLHGLAESERIAKALV